MLLDLWAGFWTEADWPPAPPEAPVETRRESRGGKHPPPRKYERLDASFWDVRERYLTRLSRVVEIPAARAPASPKMPDAASLLALEARSKLALSRAQTARTRIELQQAGTKYVSLNLALKRAVRVRQDDDDAILLAILPYLD